jgi:hypothetical protein
MQRTDRPHVVYFTEEEVAALILEKVRAEGLTAMVIGIQSVLEDRIKTTEHRNEPIVWGGAPRINIILSNVKE